VIGSLLGVLFLLAFMAAQGGVIFATAYLVLRLLKTSHWMAKGAAMIASYVLWSVLTISGYFLIGGDGGLMDGFGMILGLCITALFSSIVYLAIWTIKGREVAL
jgi:hypothetical protein